MEKTENKVTFELDEITMKQFELAVLMLGKSGDELFKEFVSNSCYRAMRRSMMPIGESLASMSTRNATKLSTLDRMKRKMEIWAGRPNYVNYNIIKSFFKAFESNENHFVTRQVMQSFYLSSDFVHPDRATEETFIRNFRMMCSDSAYGIIFKYNPENDEVKVNPELEEYFLDKKSMFLGQ